MSKHQVFSIEYDSITNVILSPCHISQPFNPDEIDPRRVDHFKFTAIWDTGATNTMITKKVAQKVGLPNTGMAKVSGIGGERLTNKYLMNLVLPNNVGLSAMSVTEGKFGEQGDVLIGMDVITKGDFAVTNNSKTVVSFRLPSFETIKFKTDPSIKKQYNFNRNDRVKVRSKETGKEMTRKWKKVEKLVKNGQYEIVDSS